MKCLFQVVEQDQDFQATLAGLENNLREQLVSGLTGTARYLFVASLHNVTQRPTILITHNLNQAQKACEDLQELLSREEVLLYPANELVAAEMAFMDHETLAGRIDVLSRLSNGFGGVLVVPLAGLRRLFPPKEVFRKQHVLLQLGQEVPIEVFITQLVSLGYERVEIVEKKGEFCVRGGIVDFFPVLFTDPIRMEWFDDEIDSIRPFSLSSQRSLEKWREVAIPPAREIVAGAGELYQAGDRVESLLHERLENVKDPAVRMSLLENISAEIEKLKQGIYFDGMYKYISQIYPDYEGLLDYISDESILVFDEPTRIMESVRQMEQEEGEWKVALLGRGEYLPQLDVSLSYDEVLRSRFQQVYLSLFMRQIPGAKPQNVVQMMCRSMQQFHGQMHVLKTEWDRWIKSEYHVLFLASNESRAQRLTRVLEDYGMNITRDLSDSLPPAARPALRIGTLQSGFEMNGIRVVVVTEGEVFTHKQRRPERQVKVDYAEKIKDYQELKSGDYVVHVNHGIGRYLGIKTLTVGGLNKDYLHIQYAANDKLYVPVEQINQVQKYTGAEDKTPRVYSLGGSEWSRVKNKVRSSIQDIAEDLIKLYAQRQEARGYAFSEDTSYQKEFEGVFPYAETPDQLRSIEEIKRDMERVQPMDRLLCGDVGYGKTEVAIRAAFKATMDGKQVAVLVPTTILAQQHFETFRERFADYPVQIRVLSRFRTKKEQEQTIAGLKDGTVDIVVGTHRLLSKDIVYKDLGLLVIDEEQRFGVKHKEKIKQIKHNIDVLTLSATPIPRTLHMAMMGVRDLSIIETPPENRFPVQTYVLEYSPGLVREAIEREIGRGGQVYFLHNETYNIDRMAEQIRTLVPHARVAIAHGKMMERELEQVMLDFLDGEIDVLVSTTIIETGVDIPNVNTLIISNADRMGLSQLYQLRGRVGRSNRIAYAYFTYQRDKVLTELAEKRLQAIKEFTELGSGFKIAMRDLSIRGAGNLLGAQQHGHIATVGFDLYSQMLKEAITELQGKETKEKRVDPQIELNVNAYLPSDYIGDEKQKIELYKKCRAVTTLEEANDLEEEIEDRFGNFPEPVITLLRVAKIRAYAYQYCIEMIQQKEEHVTLLFQNQVKNRIDGQKLFNVANEFPGKIRFITGQSMGIMFKIKGMSIESTLQMIEHFLIKIQNCFDTERSNIHE